MVNFALYQKVLEISGEDAQTVSDRMKELAEFVNKKFIDDIIIYVVQEVKDDDELERFTAFVEEGDKKLEDSVVNEYQDWLKDNSNVDFGSFFDKFEKDMFEMEVEFVKKVRKHLNDEQKKQLIDLFYKQSKLIDQAEEELEEAIASAQAPKQAS